MTDDQFLCAEDAIKFAYTNINMDMQKTSSPQRGINCTNKSDLTPWDRIAQAVMILQTLKNISDTQRSVIELRYSQDELGVIAKNLAHIASSNTAYSPKFCLDACLDWAKHGKKMDFKWWEKKLNRDRSVVWRRANRIKKDILDNYEAQAITALEPYMKQRGIIS